MRDAILDTLEAEFGIHLHGAERVIGDEEKPWLRNINMAMDAQPSLVTVSSAGIPAYLTTIIDPQLLRILTAKNRAAEIFGEVRKGDWTSETAMFSVIESSGEVSSYGDFNNNGRTSTNMNYPQRQAYLYQTIVEYGERELDREGLAKIGWANEQRTSAVTVLDKFQNLAYFKGVAGLQNYGIQTDPSLATPIAPALKAWGGVGWFNGSVLAATANEIYTDIQSLYGQLVRQATGNISMADELILVLSPSLEVGLTATNTFNVNVEDLLKKNFPKLKVMSAVQYGAYSSSNPQGIVAGELMQLIAPKVEGQDTGFCAFNEKLRTHAIVRDLSSFKQKMTQGVWGAVIRQPFAIAQMLGI